MVHTHGTYTWYLKRELDLNVRSISMLLENFRNATTAAETYVCCTLVRGAGWTLPVHNARAVQARWMMPPRCYGITPWLSAARGRVLGKMIFRWEGNQFHDGIGEASIRGAGGMDCEKGRRDTGGRGVARARGKWIKFRRMFLFGRDAGNRYGSSLWNGSFAARLFISVALQDALQNAGRSRSRRKMVCKIKLLYPLSSPSAPRCRYLQPCPLNLCNITAWHAVMEPVPRISRYISAWVILCLRFNRKCNIGNSITQWNSLANLFFIRNSEKKTDSYNDLSKAIFIFALGTKW